MSWLASTVATRLLEAGATPDEALELTIEGDIEPQAAADAIENAVAGASE